MGTGVGVPSQCGQTEKGKKGYVENQVTCAQFPPLLCLDTQVEVEGHKPEL